MKNLTIISHPLVKRDLTLLRNEQTPSNAFRSVLRRTASLMAYEVTKDLRLRGIKVRTPLERTAGHVVRDPIILIPILRAGLGLVGGFVEVIPDARVGHIGLYRDPETLRPVEYYCKLPEDIGERDILIVDPMLATGGSASAAVQFLRDKGAREINLLCLIAAPEGIEEVATTCDDVKIYVAAVDSHLNEHGYIVPGLGDAGDRLFGTK